MPEYTKLDVGIYVKSFYIENASSGDFEEKFFWRIFFNACNIRVNTKVTRKIRIPLNVSGKKIGIKLIA